MENKIIADRYNNRIVAYVANQPEKIIDEISRLQMKNLSSKIIIYTLNPFVEKFMENQFQKEGKIDGFFRGEDAVVLSKYHDISRSVSDDESTKEQVIEITRNDNKVVSNLILDEGFTVEIAKKENAEELALLYKKIFKYYPTPIYDPVYLRENMGENYLFIVVKINDKIVSAASAMIDSKYNNAEITDCVTHPDHRGKNLLTFIIQAIEKELNKKNIYSLYSLTRADSVAMNLTIKRLGYRFQGRLKNNCIIYTGFEDMNIWTKYKKIN